jgi:predicted RNA binding protein with dsRBD fold (UPF0201 family)
MLRVRVETPCRATEDPSKVRVALLNLFPDLVFEREDDRFVGTTASLERLRELIRAQRIRDSARGQFLAGRFRDRTRVALNKQAALMGIVNFSVGSALGEIEVEIESDTLGAVIDDVAESTVPREVRPSDRTEGT